MLKELMFTVLLIRLVTELVFNALCPLGDGTMLLAASKVLDRLKPVIGVNTDPER